MLCTLPSCSPRAACTFLAGTAGVLATLVLNTILDPVKTETIKQLAAADPMFRNVPGAPLAVPTITLGLAIGVLFASFVALAQSVRLYTHLVRAAPGAAMLPSPPRGVASELTPVL